MVIGAEVVARVCALLPAGSSRVLASGDSALESAARAAGHRVVGDLASGSAAGDSLDAAVLASSTGEIHAEVLGELHAALVERGSLIVVAPASARRVLVVALSEAGFVVAAVEAAGDAALLQGRRDDFRVRSYRDGDASAILGLFHRVFHPNRGFDHLRWKYLEAPYGSRRISLALDAHDQLAAHYAGYPVPLHDALAEPPRDLVALHVGDTMTAPEARAIGRGETSLLGRTVRHFYAAYCEEQVAFNYGFNRGNIQKFSLRFVRAERAEDVGFRVRDLATSPLAKPSRPRLAWSGLTVDELTSRDAVGDEWDAFFHRVAPAYGLLVRRDAAYVRWRYLECPDTRFRLFAARRRGRLAGWGVFRVDGEALVWGDALFERDSEHAVEALLAAAVAASGGALNRIEGWFPDRPKWWTAVLARRGFRRLPHPQELALMVVPFADAATARSLASRLYYTQGDSDLF